MASGDTKTQEYLSLAANGARADLPAARGCCNTRTQDLIVDVADRIITEEETRAREDAILQDEIDEIRNNPDVADIVTTYADLQNYDTSHLTDKDIIRVLADETHDGASTYYRWSSNTQSFTYVGEAGDYYTKSQMDTLLDAKQDELTAGDNITIEDESGALVISATDTTYSAFTGTDGTAAGTAGLVPAPATTDAGKFLKADGTWDTAGGNDQSGIVKLTSADYDYPSNNPDGVALWQLSPGRYNLESADVYIDTYNKIRFSAGAQYTQTFSTGGVIWTNEGGLTSVLPTGQTFGKRYNNALVLSYGQITEYTGSDQWLIMSQNAVTNFVNSRIMQNSGAPTGSTVGTIGQLIEDTTNGKLYICTDATNPYVWEEVGAGGGYSPIISNNTLYL